MTPLVVRCPNTRGPVVTRVDTSIEGLAEVWDKTLRLSCPHCGVEHYVKVREAFIQSEISDMALHHVPLAKGD
jgi:hypothetical protein